LTFNELNSLNRPQASEQLFLLCYEVLLAHKQNVFSYLLKDPSIRFLTQKLYGDYRQIEAVPEYKHAEEALNGFKSTLVGRLLLE
jgi:hypothetical protein